MIAGIVVIGRNEGPRLVECLKSAISEAEYPLVYVDSDSSDGSIASAHALGVDIVRLDSTRPLSAARARNAGFEHLVQRFPTVRFVQFLDGDCTLLPGWIEAGVRALSDKPGLAVVVGHLSERNVDASIYNRLCALEWRMEPGELRRYGALGGIAMMRADVFHELGGFRPEVIAGEDSELAIRMQLRGYGVAKIDAPMATHDANILEFRQWWRRAVRAGHAIGQRFDLNGKTVARDCARERASTVFWGMGLPSAALAAIPLTQGASVPVAILAYIALAIRVFRARRQGGDDPQDALLYAIFTVAAKFANAVGLLRFYLNKMANRFEIIEYK